ncbi:hypothetical protein HJC23_002299 [Cyclotella cryptica]|uniref:Uncharacterized protein n=1 Tax=Cyclotella cryptica TaxID=29204 RepID=A0ABD3QN12_9STRA
MQRTNSNRKKTDILIPEPRHRVGPKGVSSGISFRNLPPPSLDEIKKVCEHYQDKCAGTYESLASRYVYQMASEIEDLVDIMKGESSASGASLPSQNKHSCKARDEKRVKRNSPTTMPHRSPDSCKAKHGSRPSHHSPDSSKTREASRSSRNRNPTIHSKFDHHGHRHGDRTHTTHRKHDAAEKERRRWRNEFQSNHPESLCDENRCLSTWSSSVSSDDESTHQNFISSKPKYIKMARKLECRHDPVIKWPQEEGGNKSYRIESRQHDEVLHWLKEEMDRSQYLIKRSKQMHDEEIEKAKNELEKIKKAAKIIIQAVHKKAKENSAKLEANVQSERKQRVKSDKLVESLIKSQTNQLNQLRKLTCHDDELSEYCDNRNEGLSGLMGDLDLTSVLDELAEDAFQQSYCS